jgi:hypothetical protein
MNPFSIEYNGLVIDSDSKYRVSKLEGVDGLNIRMSEDPITGGDGGNIWAQKYDMRTIVFEGIIKGDDVVDFFLQRRAFVKAFAINTNNLLKITMWDGTIRQIYAKVINSPMIVNTNGRTTFTNYHVELKAPFPFFTGDVATTQRSATAYLISKVGFPIPNPIPTPLTGSSENKVTLANNGDFINYPSIRISNAVSNPSLLNTTSGVGFSIDTTLVDGEYIDIYYDQNGLFVYKNDGTNLMSSFKGKLPSMLLGNNDFIFTASSYSATSQLTITYSDIFISA